MAAREDILNFMRQIKAGKQAVKETEFKQQAVEEAQAQYNQTLEDYARGLTAYEGELPLHQEKVADWEQATEAQRQAHDQSLTAWGNKTSPQWQTYNQQQAAYNAWTPQITEYYHVGFPTSNPGVWNTNPSGSTRSRQVDNPTARPSAPTTPAQPTAPTYAPQPQMTTQHPGDMPSFQFVMPETPYQSALGKASMNSNLPALQRSSQDDASRYYQAIAAQQNQTPWWRR